MAKNENAQAAAEAIGRAEMEITTPTVPGTPILNPAVTDRYGLERRVLGFVTEETDKTALGPRNTLHSITYSVMRDRNTTHPPDTHERLEVEGRSTEEIAQRVLDILAALVSKGLVTQHKDGTYKVTDAGQRELNS